MIEAFICLVVILSVIGGAAYIGSNSDVKVYAPEQVYFMNDVGLVEIINYKGRIPIVTDTIFGSQLSPPSVLYKTRTGKSYWMDVQDFQRITRKVTNKELGLR